MIITVFVVCFRFGDYGLRVWEMRRQKHTKNNKSQSRLLFTFDYSLIYRFVFLSFL